MTDPAPPAIAALLTDLVDLDVATDATTLRRKSRDGYWFSPVLAKALDAMRADCIVTPRNEVEALRVLSACARHGVPCTPRGAGTGNYGQAVPLAGGVIMDLTQLDQIEWIRPGRARCGAGVRLGALDAACRDAVGWELRLYPSTVKTATIGGFIAGGSTGIGGISWGLLSSPGNVVKARVATLQAEPRILELAGPDLARVHHAYGVTGVILAVEIALAPAQEWRDVIVSFSAFETAVRFAQNVAEQPGLSKKLCSLVASPIPQAYFGDVGKQIAEGRHALMLMITPEDVDALRSLVDAEPDAVFEADAIAALRQPVSEFSWNHTTQHALKYDRSVSYLQVLFDGPDHIDKILWAYRQFGDETPMHLEFIRFGGAIRCFGLQLLRFSTEERLRAITAEIEAQGCPCFDPHTTSLEDGGMKQVDLVQLAFKLESDPLGLLNPGKMRAWEDRATLLPAIPNSNSRFIL